MCADRRDSVGRIVHYDAKNLFRPLRIGRATMKNRFAVPNLTRLRADDDHVPTEMMVRHYSDRAEFGLIVSEGTMIQRGYSGFAYEPGIYTKEQVEGWRKVTEAVHVRGGIIFCQLDHAGRATVPANVDSDVEIMGPSLHGIHSHKQLGVFSRDGKTQRFPERVRAMTLDDIAATVERFARAARNAMAAGFDGVEINAGDGHLLDQFLRDSSNSRTDRYGGSSANCARLLLQVVDACIRAIGADRVAVKITPLESLNDMSDADPQALTRFVAQRLSDRKIAYLHVSRGDVLTPQSGANLWAREAFHGALISSLGYDVAAAEAEIAANGADAVAFGQLSMANPDLVELVLHGRPTAPNIDLELICGRGPEGYIPSDPEPLPVAPDDIAAQEHERHEEFVVEESMMPRRFSAMDRDEAAALAAAEAAVVPAEAEEDVPQEVDHAVHEPVEDRALTEQAPEEEAAEEPSKVRLCMPARHLFRPLFMGAHALKNRIAAFAPDSCAAGVYTVSTSPEQAHNDDADAESVGRYYVERAGFGAIFTPPCTLAAGGLSDAAKHTWQAVTTAVHAKGGLLIASLQDDGTSSSDDFVKAAEDALEAGFDAIMLCAVRDASNDTAPFLAAVNACAEAIGKHFVGACVDAQMPCDVLRSTADTLGIIGVGFLVITSEPGETKEAMQEAAQACRAAKEVFDEGAVLCDVPIMWVDDAERLIEGGAVDGVCLSKLARLNADLPAKVIHGACVQVRE